VPFVSFVAFRNFSNHWKNRLMPTSYQIVQG
jgi:hypothetical protein